MFQAKLKPKLSKLTYRWPQGFSEENLFSEKEKIFLNQFWRVSGDLPAFCEKSPDGVFKTASYVSAGTSWLEIIFFQENQSSSSSFSYFERNICAFLSETNERVFQNCNFRLQRKFLLDCTEKSIFLNHFRTLGEKFVVLGNNFSAVLSELPSTCL